MADADERFRTFYARRPHPAFVRVPGIEPWTKLLPPVEPVTITIGEIEDVAAFAATRRQK